MNSNLSRERLSARFGSFRVADRDVPGAFRVCTSDGKALYPMSQFDDEGALIPGIDALVQSLGATDGWVILYWLTSPRSDFGGRTALDVLRGGDRDENSRLHECAVEDAAAWV